MPTMDELYTALRNADAAGDTAAATKLAAHIKATRVQTEAAPAPRDKGFGEQLNDFVSDVPRQVGLTGRYALEGVGGMADLVATPMRALMNTLPGVDIKPGVGQVAANAVGLPQPRTPQERVVGDAARMGFGAAGGVGLAKTVAGATTGTTKAVSNMMAANPGMQLASGGAAGAAGGYTRETGGNDTSQLLASLAAGIGTPFAMAGVDKARRVAQSIGTRPAPSPVQVDITINNAMRGSDIDLAQLPAAVAQGIRQDVAKAMQIGDNLDAAAIRRLADYRLTGATPNRAGLTLSPADVTQQKNLAKLGINSKDPAAQALGEMQNANNRQMTTGINALGANTADDTIAGGSKIMGALEQRNARAKDLISQRYEAARAADGRSAALDPSAFTQRANNLLDEALLGGKLPADVRNLLNQAATGRMPLTVDVAEQFKTRIGELQRSTFDMAERKALGMVRSALDDTPLLPGQEIGQEAMGAFNQARSLNRKWMGIVEKTPALQAVRDGIEPDKFVQQYILGAGGKSNVMDVAMLKSSIKGSPEAMTAVKEQITSFLKSKALSGNADEVGNFSQSGYNKALAAIGDRKLRLFFSPDDINQMKAIGRVASYEQFQPVGSAVNNSNTAGAGLSAILDRIGGSALLSKIPFGKQAIGDPLANIMLGMQAKQTLNVPRALTDGTRQALPRPRQGMMLSPAMLMGSEDEETRRRREAGLLFP